MRKHFLYRWFGIGKVPKKFMPVIQQEGIVLIDEGLSATVTFRNFRAPGKRYSWRKNWFMGSLVLTNKTLLSFASFRTVIGIPLNHERLRELHCSIEGEHTLLFEFDVSVFHEGWTGDMEVRFKTREARLFKEMIAAKQKVGSNYSR